VSAIRVLVVEDRPDYQKIFTNIVKNKLGYDFHIASSFKDSKELLRRFVFHVALIDLSLDDNDHNNRDGFRVLDIIKQLDMGTKSIILTAYGKIRDADKALFEKYDLLGFIDKGDMEISDVARRIQDAVEKAQMDMLRPSKSLWEFQQVFGDKPIDWLLKSLVGETVEITPLKISSLELFLKRLLASFAPFQVGNNEPTIFYPEANAPTIKVRLWSKSLGYAIEAWIGSFNIMDTLVQPISESIYSKQFGYEERVKEIFDKVEFPSYGGAVYKLKGVDFKEFEIPTT
jgi:ActR/RegA family two-component response regulator